MSGFTSWWPRQTRITKIMAVVVAGIVGILVIAIVASVASTPKSTKRSSSTVAKATEVTTPAVAATSATEKSARAWISKDFHDANAVQADVESAMADIALVGSHATMADEAEIVQQAQSGHDDIDGRRSNFYTNTGDSGLLGDGEAAVAVGANELKNAMGALVAYLGNSTPVTLASFQTQYQKGQNDWNEGLTTIYRIAHKSGASTITQAQISRIAKTMTEIANPKQS